MAEGRARFQDSGCGTLSEEVEVPPEYRMMVVDFLQPFETKYIKTKSSTQKNGFIDGKRVVVELEKPNFVWNGWSVRIALYFMI